MIVACATGALLATPAAHAAYEIARGTTAGVPVYTTPNGAIEQMLDRASGNSGEPRGFMVLDERFVRGERWLEVRLGTRPNTAAGWILASDVEIDRTVMRIAVSIRTRTLTVYRDNRVALRTKVVIGKSSTPTPTGTFAVWDETPVSNSIYSPYVLELTAHSNALKTFNGGEARVAIHGMNGPLAVTPGTAQSNGCIRVPPAAMGRIAALVVTGTPVTITN